jgi:hypothetical protein
MSWANAKSLARLAAFMANKGTFNGQKIISEKSWNEIMSEEKAISEDMGLMTAYTKGGFNHF